MARPVGSGRTIEQPRAVSSYQPPPQIVPRDLMFFRPAKGLDLTTSLQYLDHSHTPFMQNLSIDRGIIASRNGFVTLGAAAPETLLLCADVETSLGPASRNTINQGAAAGWSGGTANGIETLSTPANAGGNFQVAAASRLICFIGDPAADANVVAYDGNYYVTVKLITSNTYNGVYSNSTAYIDVEVSTDGGTTWTVLKANAAQVHAQGGGNSNTNVAQVILNVTGFPAHVKFRLALTLQGFLVDGTTGSAAGSVQVYNTAWLTDNYGITWTATGSGNTPTRVPVRWTTGHLQYFVTNVWTNIIAYSATQASLGVPVFIPYTGWEGYLIWCLPQEAAIPGSVPLQATTLVGNGAGSSRALAGGAAPNCADVTVFGGRLIASRPGNPSVLLNRIQWCAKYNIDDWTGVGSGFQDFIFSPAGGGESRLVEEVMAVRPINDQTALAILEHSIWRMDITGAVDTPFNFSVLIDHIGTVARQTIRGVPGGVIFLGYDDVYVITLAGVQRIGDPIIKSILPTIQSLRQCYGYYDASRQWYWLTFGGSTSIFIYSFRDKLWFEHVMSGVIYAIDTTFQYNTAMIGGQVANLLSPVFGVNLTGANCLFTVQESATSQKDIADNGGLTDPLIEIRTGMIHAESPLRKVELVEAQLEYENLSASSQQLIFDYSKDGGVTWTQYSSVNVSTTTRPDIVSVRGALETAFLQVRVRANNLGQIILHALHLFVTDGAMIRP